MRILFVKTSSLGDVIHHCPAVSDVRRQYPDAIVDWVLEEPFTEVAALHPGVRRVLPVAVRRWRKRLASPATWRELRAFRHTLAAETYDFVIDTQGLLKSALIACGARGPKHGFDALSAREPFASRWYDVRHAVPRALHAVERNRRLTALALGIVAEGACDYGLVPSREPPLALDARYCVLLSMTSRTDKLWPEERWRALGRELAERDLISILPWGSAAERMRCERIASAVKHAIVPRRLSITQLASLMQGAHGVIGVDTGLAHLGAALGVRSVGIYCGTDPALTGLYASTPVANLGGLEQAPSAAAVLAAFEDIA